MFFSYDGWAATARSAASNASAGLRSERSTGAWPVSACARSFAVRATSSALTNQIRARSRSPLRASLRPIASAL